MPEPSKPALPPMLGIAFGILVVSSAAIMIRLAQAYAPSRVIAAWRLSLAALVLAPLALRYEKQALTTLTRRERWLALASGALLALHFAAWITSLEYTSVASSVVFVSTTPLFVALLSPLLLRERLSIWIVAGLLLALVGGTGIALSDACGPTASTGCLDSILQPSDANGQTLLGDALALVGALAAAGYLMIGRRLRAHLSLLAYTALCYGSAALVLVAWMLLSGAAPFGYPPVAYALFAGLALGPQLLGHSSFNWALRYLPAALVSLTLLGEPVGSTILAVWLLGEQPSAIKWGAIGLTLVGIYIASRGTTAAREAPAS